MIHPSFCLRGNILTPGGLRKDHVLEVVQGRIARIIPWKKWRGKIPVLDMRPGILVPGLIDLQVNPVGRFSFASGGEGVAEELGQFLARGGCTAYLAAFITKDMPALALEIATAKAAMKGRGSCGARLLGIHLEGPFLNPVRRGIHPKRYLQVPTRKNVAKILRTAEGALRMMTLAPELPGGLDLVRALRAKKIIPSIGHSNATYEEAVRSFDAGVQTATHLFNASSPFHQRAPGVPGAVLADSRIVAQIIADGAHAHPACVDLAYQWKGRRGLAVVTDRLATNQNGFVFAGKQISRKRGGFESAGGILAGSCVTPAQSLDRLQSFVKAPLEDLIECLSLTPARLLGLERKKGSLETGKDADMVWLDTQGNVAATWVEGRQVYVRDHRIRRT